MWVWLVVPCGAQAGLSLDEVLQRHRALVDDTRTGTRATSLSTPALAAPDAFTLAVFGARAPTPPLLRPAAAGAGGAQLLFGSGNYDDAGADGGDAGAPSWRLGVSWTARDRYRFELDGSELALPLGGGRAYVSVQHRHWGPSWVGSLILDGAAAPVAALGWRRTAPARPHSPWLSWLGPWSVDVFAGTLQGHTEPARPRLLGARLQFAPADGLEIGLSRVLEWGGRGREENLGSLWDAVSGRDNVDGDAYDPSNQLGGFDLRYTRRMGAAGSWSVYGQAIGEDEAGGMPSKYLASFGTDAAFETAGGASLRVFAEHADTVAGGISGHPHYGTAYRHGVYRQGYTQQGLPLGFPAGGDVVLTSVGLIADRAPWSAMLMLHHGRAQPGTQLFAQPGPLRGADAELAWQAADGRERLGLTLSAWRDPLERRTRAQIWWQHLLR